MTNDRELDFCETSEVHEELLKTVRDTLPPEEELYDLAELFKVFGDSTRIRILFVLFEAEVCVCDLAAALNMTVSAVSHQLKILKQNKLIKNRREGRSVFYSLADDHVRTIVSQGMEHIEEEKTTLHFIPETVMPSPGYFHALIHSFFIFYLG